MRNSQGDFLGAGYGITVIARTVPLCYLRLLSKKMAMAT